MRKVAGYTIIEVLVAVVILAIAIPGLTYFVLGSRKTQISSVRFENAAAFGQKVFDDLSVLPSAQVKPSGSVTTTIDGQSYTASWIKKPLALGGNNLEITVSWNVGGKNRSSVLNGVLP